ncbi:hypothetical protein LSUB1_G007778 [Lachnellula subtilissima]|uniref:Uncharacterized protein n=1 Tax=Lachnellula subtilissima TaxID=602034 RepID=A0A8H8RCL4_9HELO|nr:hypothetical protein LSUB1_G007778 [Lachnellula subtilissima]
MQLSSHKFTKDVKSILQMMEDMPPLQRRLVKTILTLPGTTLEEEFSRCNASINAIVAYCKFKEAKKEALKAAILLVFIEKRPLICFVCLGRQGLEFTKRMYKFASPGDLTKHFKRKHLS